MFTFVVGALVITLHFWDTVGFRRQWCYRTPHLLVRLKLQVLAGNQQCNHAYRHHNYPVYSLVVRVVTSAIFTVDVSK